MAPDASPTVRAQVTLVGETAEKLLLIVAREGNPVSTVLRRLISIGLRHEEETLNGHS